MSLFSGTLSGMKLVIEVVEGGGSVYVATDSPEIVLPEADGPDESIKPFTPIPVQEQMLLDVKLRKVLTYNRCDAAKTQIGEVRIDVSHLSDPSPRAIDGSWSILVSGIGCAVVVTVGQTLAVAARTDGYFSSNLGITGLAQKYGAVHSLIKIAHSPDEMRATRIVSGEADALLGCNLVAAAGDEALSNVTLGKSVAVTDTTVLPTSEFSKNPDWQLSGAEQVERLTRVLGEAVHAFEAQTLAEKAMGPDVRQHGADGRRVAAGRHPAVIGGHSPRDRVERRGRGEEPAGLSSRAIGAGRARGGARRRSRAVPFTLSTVSICSLGEVAVVSDKPFWFQLYMQRDRGIVTELLDGAWRPGVWTLVFTVDLAMVGERYRDTSNGIAGGVTSKFAKLRAGPLSYAAHPGWELDVGVKGKPHTFGKLAAYVPTASNSTPR